MKTSSVLLLAGACVLAAASALAARALMRPPPPVTIVKEVEVKVEAPKTRRILVAARDLQPGQFLDGASLRPLDVPLEAVQASDIEAGRANEQGVYGATLRQPISEGSSLRDDLMVRPGEPGFISAVLQPGMRAISVPTNAVASNAGLVAAGDRVDVILSLERSGLGGESEAGQPPALAAETILRNVRVLALDDSVASLAPEADSNGAKAPVNRQRRYFETITLEVVPADAEKLAVAKEIGTLHVALRRVGESDVPVSPQAGQAVTRLADTTAIFVRRGTPAESGPPSVRTFKGKDQSKVVFGGDQ